MGLAASAQQIAEHYGSNAEKILMTSKYIFEGKEIKDNPFKDIKTGMTHNARLVLITAIYRNYGNKLKLGTIEIADEITQFHISNNGEIYEDAPSHWDPPQVNGVYFCNQYDTMQYSINADNDPIALKQLAGVGFNIANYDQEGNIKPFRGYKAFGRAYTSKEDLYLELSKYPDVSIPDSLIKK